MVYLSPIQVLAAALRTLSAGDVRKHAVLLASTWLYVHLQERRLWPDVDSVPVLLQWLLARLSSVSSSCRHTRQRTGSSLYGRVQYSRHRGRLSRV